MNGKSVKKLVAVVGPTGSGKTATAVVLAGKYNGVIVSADSRQIYKNLDIGTNKEGNISLWQGEPARIIDDIPQLLVDIAEPGEPFTLHIWLTKARKLIEKIWSNGQLPIVVGGTGLYVTALLEGYEVGGGRNSKKKQPVDFEALVLEMDVDRQELYRRSDQRIIKIFNAVIGETTSLLDSGVSVDWLSRIGLDYRFALKVIENDLSGEVASAQLQAASRQYIRRQLTWWRHHGEPVRTETLDQAVSIVEPFLNN